MALGWNEIKSRALSFSKEWADTSKEEADAKPFLVEFFNVFGINNKRFSTFEHRVKKLDNKDGYIDLLWKGIILIEMKSKGKNLDKAYQQAKDYLHGLRQHELPKYILVSDFENFRLYNLEDNETQDITVVEFQLKDLVYHVMHFDYLLGYPKKIYQEQDPANIKAAELIGKFHDKLKEIGYVGHPLEVYLVRVLFLLFAEDTTIFNKQQFQDYIERRTNIDGSDLAAKMQELFQVLNTPKESRFKNLDEQLADFAYINGKLFEENLPIASFDSKMRQALLECSYLDWSKISPAIFGSMFQSVMNPTERRNLGAHYTSETNILKVIKPLFLDDLWAEFEKVKDNKNKLVYFHKKLGTLKFLDPACGCGNFLVITYRELRLLELEVLKVLYKTRQQVLDVLEILLIDVDQFYGIEYEEFPARIAEVAMWLIDHQMNMLVNKEFGQYAVRLPLKKAAKIIHGNALQIEWGDLLEKQTIEIEVENTTLILQEPSTDYQTVNVRTKNLTIIDERISTSEKIVINNTFDYILGNPPFIGKSVKNDSQKADIEKVFAGVKGAGVMDYVAAWYVKAAQLIQNTKIKAAFVSTNSISQGEQVGILWNLLFNQYKIKIHFAHRSFKWSNEAKENAAVHCVIIGFASFEADEKRLFDYENTKGEAHELKVKNINPYLLEGKDFVLLARAKPICNVPSILFGSKLVDDGNYLFTEEEKNQFLLKEPQSLEFFKEILSGDEFLNGKKRWCLWLKDISPSKLNELRLVNKRVANVKIFRLKSTKIPTQKAANYPTLFAELRQPENDFLLIPLTSSENRKYIPLSFFPKECIVTNSCSVVENATLFHFGILTSLMHITWVKSVCGRLESRLRYSNTIVYNNYPFPENPTDKQIKAIEAAAQKVLDVRLAFPNSSLADLYSIISMPPALVKAHNELDKAVDLAYRPQPFTSNANRMVFLFELYEKYTAGLFIKEKRKRKK